jgi:hypothetical protein
MPHYAFRTSSSPEYPVIFESPTIEDALMELIDRMVYDAEFATDLATGLVVWSEKPEEVGTLCYPMEAYHVWPMYQDSKGHVYDVFVVPHGNATPDFATVCGDEALAEPKYNHAFTMWVTDRPMSEYPRVKWFG